MLCSIKELGVKLLRYIKIIYQEYDEGNEPAQVGHYVCDGCGKPFIVEPVITYKVKKEEEAKDFSELSASLLD